MFKLFVLLGSINAFLAVALGAFGAHGLKSKITPDLLAIYETGVQYHMFHAAGLILVGLIADRLGGTPLVMWSGWLLLFGIIIFSGSLYALSMTGIRALGAITPIGGLAFISGWILLGIATLKR